MAVITLTSGVVRTKLPSRVLNEILAFDMAEFLGHLRQVNAIVAWATGRPDPRSHRPAGSRTEPDTTPRVKGAGVHGPESRYWSLGQELPSG